MIMVIDDIHRYDHSPIRCPKKKDADVLVNGHMLGEDLLLPISGFFHGETEIPRTKRRKIIDKWKFAVGKIIYKCVIHPSQMGKN